MYGTTPMSVVINDDHNSDHMEGSSKIMMPPTHSQYPLYNDEDMDHQYSTSSRSTSGRVIREIIV